MNRNSTRHGDCCGASPPRQRAVLVLRIHLDLPDHEIAQLLDRPEPTVRSLAFRALASLRKDLS